MQTIELTRVKFVWATVRTMRNNGLEFYVLLSEFTVGDMLLIITSFRFFLVESSNVFDTEKITETTTTRKKVW